MLYVLTLIWIVPVTSNSKIRELAPIEKCLNISTNVASECIRRHLNPRTIQACYAMSETIYSSLSKEKVREYCFYNINEFSSLKSCLAATKKFYMDENKDQALFECYRQFAPEINERQCLKISKMMSYRERRSYLENHCHNL